MSSSEIPTTETIAPAAVISEEVPAAPLTPAAATDKVAELTTTAETSAADAPAAEALAHDTPEATPVAEEVKIEDDKKEKKHTRKPFADLLSKILKPHPQEKSAVEKKEATDASAPVTEEAAPAPAPEATTETTEAVADTPVEAPAVEEVVKEASSPRKERGNIFEKLTALVMKPKSPKLKKTDAHKEDGDEIPVVEETAEPQPTADAPVVSPEAAPAVESAEAVPVEAPAASETPEELKTEKKEKTPKDLAKLARRFSGRLFGVEKKKESKRPEPTPEEAEGVASSEAPAVADANTDAAPQIPVDTPAESSPEALQSTNDSAPVIAAAA